MYSNIYEEPNFEMTARHSKEEESRERVERIVDIYESEDGLIGRGAHFLVQDGGTDTDRKPPSNLCRTVSICLSVLCLLLLIWSGVLVKLYIVAVLNKNQLRTELEETKKALDKMNNDYCLVEETDQEQNKTTGWKRFGCFCFYASPEKKNWTESKNDCQRRGASLAIVNKISKQNLVSDLERLGESWIGLEGVKGWNSDWKWVDGSQTEYWGWKKNVNLRFSGDGSKAFIDLQGHWDHAQNGSKHWICEKRIC